MDTEDVLALPWIAVMIFVIVFVAMVGMAEYEREATGPGPAITLRYYAEGAAEGPPF